MLGLGLNLAMLASGGGVGTFNLHLDSDAAGGGDGSLATPFNSPSDLLAAMGSSANLRVGVKYGSVLTGSLVLTADHRGALIDSYGDEEDGLPEWRCDDAIDPGDFSLAAGRTNVYVVSLTVETDAAFAEWPGIWEDGVALSPSAVNLSSSEGRPGTFWHGTVTDDSTIDVYVHAYGSTNPTSDGKEYRASVRKGLIAWDAEDVTIRNQKGRRNYTSYGSISGGRGCRLQNIECYEGNTHCISYRPGASASGRLAVLEDCLAQNAVRPDASPTLFIGYESIAPATSGATVRRCRAELTYSNRLPIQTVEGATSANPCVVTITGHPYANSDILIASGFTSPWDVLNGQRFVVAGAATDTINLQQMSVTGSQVNYSTAALAAYSANGGEFRLAPYHQSTLGFYTHTDGASTFDEINYEDCETFGCGVPLVAANTDVTNVTGGTFEQFFYVYKDFVGEVNITGITASNVPPITGATAAQSNGNNAVLNVEQSTFRINATGNFRILHTGCTLRLNQVETIGFNVIVNVNVAGVVLDLQDNDYVPESRQFNPYNIGSGATGLTLTSDNNDFNGASVNIIYLGTTYATFAEYKTASGQDANSTP